MKINFITLALLFTISASAFAEYYPTDPLSSWSVKKSATAGVYVNDSDNISISDIFDMKRSMLSVQYSPISESVITKSSISGTTVDMPQMLEAYFGIAIKEQMYFAMAGAYDPRLSYTNNKSSGSKSKENNPTAMIRPVLRINDKISLEYMFIYNGYNFNQNNGNDITNKYIQKHRAGVGVWAADNVRLTIPLSFTIGKENFKSSASESKIDTMRIDFDPEVWVSLEQGPLTGVNIGLNINADAINKDSQMTAKNPTRFGGFVSVYPSLRWTLAEGIVELGTDPEVGLELEISTRGYASGENGNTSTNMIKPFLNLPLGTVIKAGQYVQFYAGFTYSLEYLFNTIDDKTSATPAKINENVFISKMSAMAGLGIHVKEDVSIDFMIKVLLAANSAGNYPNSSSKNIFDIDRIGIQATYRF